MGRRRQPAPAEPGYHSRGAAQTAANASRYHGYGEPMWHRRPSRRLIDGNPDPRDILVTGDQTIDWVVRPVGDYDVRGADERLHVDADLYWHKGGMFLLRSMVNAALNDGHDGVDHTHSADLPREHELAAYETGYNHSFAVLHEYKPDQNELSRWREWRNVDEKTKIGTEAPVSER